MSDSAWPLVEGWSADAANAHELLPADDETGAAALAALEGVTEWSVLGSLARRCAALVVDEWLLVLGAGGGGHPGLVDFNRGDDALSGALIVGVDALGGGFAVNGGGLPAGEQGEVCYLAPDTLRWEAAEMGHSAWVQWTLSGPVETFYDDLRWPGWRDMASALEPGQGIAAYPPPWSEEGRGDDVTRRPVPLHDVWGVLLSAARQMHGE